MTRTSKEISFNNNVHAPQEDLDTKKLIASLRKTLGNKIVRYAIKKLEKPKNIERLLGIYAGVLTPKGWNEKVLSLILSKALSRSAKKFGVDESLLKKNLKDSYMRKGIANILMGIAKYGITRPQKLYAPFMVVWDFTRQCNLHCKHCYANATPYPAPDELTLEEKYEVLRQLDEAGVAAISFSGGEPLTNKDFWHIARKAAELGFYVSIATNGTLISEKVAQRLKEVGVRYVEISIDSADPKKHDEFRGVKGAWQRAINGIKNAKKAGISVGIATTVTKMNYRHLPELIKLARDLEVDRFIAFNFVPTGRGKEIIETDLSPKEREEILNYLYKELTKDKMQVFSTAPMYAIVSLKHIDEGGKLTPTHFAELSIPEEYLSEGFALAEFLGGCGAGRIYCSIERNGDIQPCVFLPINVGNVLKDGFLNVWHNNEILQKLRDREHYACSDCPYRYICGGCRARAYAYYGDISAPDPSCIYNEDKWEELVQSVKVQTKEKTIAKPQLISSSVQTKWKER